MKVMVHVWENLFDAVINYIKKVWMVGMSMYVHTCASLNQTVHYMGVGEKTAIIQELGEL